MEIKTVFVAHILTFHDDYKLRGNDPATIYGPKVFSRVEDAEAWLAPRLYQHYEDIRFDKEQLEEVEIDLKELKEVDGRYQLKDSSINDFDLLSNIEQMCCCDGQFVPRTLEYGLDEQEIEFPIEKRKRAKK